MTALNLDEPAPVYAIGDPVIVWVGVAQALGYVAAIIRTNVRQFKFVVSTAACDVVVTADEIWPAGNVVAFRPLDTLPSEMQP